MKSQFDTYLMMAEEDLRDQVPPDRRHEVGLPDVDPNAVDAAPQDTGTPAPVDAGDDKKELEAAYVKIKKQAETTEKTMNQLYTTIDEMSPEENAQFMSVYDNLNQLLLGFQDMVITIQRLINK